MVSKKILIDETEGVYMLEIDGEIKRIIRFADFEEIHINDIFFDIKCSEIPGEMNFFMDKTSYEDLNFEYINAVNIEKNGQLTRFQYDLRAYSGIRETSILNANMILKNVAEQAKQNQWKVTEYYDHYDSDSLTIELTTREDLVIRDKIRSDVDLFLIMLQKSQAGLLSTIKNGVFYLPCEETDK